MLTRRFFLTASAGSLVAAGLPVSAALTSAPKAHAAIFEEQRLGELCKIHSDGQSVAQLQLTAVEQQFVAETRVAQYIFNFASAVPVYLPEASYQVIHPSLGALDLFLQPCGGFKGNQHDGLQYRACMSMLRKS